MLLDTIIVVVLRLVELLLDFVHKQLVTRAGSQGKVSSDGMDVVDEDKDLFFSAVVTSLTSV